MATKFYLVGENSPFAPSLGEKSTALPVGTFKDLSIGDGQRRSLLFDKGHFNDSASGNSIAQTAHQDNYMARFTSKPLYASITAQTWTLAVVTHQTNAAANSFTILSLYVWRPSDSSVVGFVYDSDTPLGVEWGNDADGQVLTFAGGAVTIAQGDVLVLEFWRHAAQGMANAYTQAVYWGGQTDVTDATADALNPASYLSTPQDGIMFRGLGAEAVHLEPLTVFDGGSSSP